MDPWDRSIKIQHGTIHGTYGKKYTYYVCYFNYVGRVNTRIKKNLKLKIHLLSSIE